jgi:hypothetical protein
MVYRAESRARVQSHSTVTATRSAGADNGCVVWFNLIMRIPIQLSVSHTSQSHLPLLECLSRELLADTKVIDPSSDLYDISAQPYNSRLEHNMARPLAIVYRE